MFRKSLILGCLAALLAGAPAMAAPISGGLNISSGITTDAPGGNLAFNDTITVTGATFNTGSGDLSVVPDGTAVTLAAFAITQNTAFSFTSSFGNYVGTINLIGFAGSGTSLSVTLFTSGTFTPSALLPGLEANPQTFLTFNLNQSGTAKNSSGTMASPAIPPPPGNVPVPMSILLMGVGLLGLGAAMRKRG